MFVEILRGLETVPFDKEMRQKIRFVEILRGLETGRSSPYLLQPKLVCRDP